MLFRRYLWNCTMTSFCQGLQHVHASCVALNHVQGHRRVWTNKDSCVFECELSWVLAALVCSVRLKSWIIMFHPGFYWLLISLVVFLSNKSKITSLRDHHHCSTCINGQEWMCTCVKLQVQIRRCWDNWTEYLLHRRLCLRNVFVVYCVAVHCYLSYPVFYFIIFSLFLLLLCLVIDRKVWFQFWKKPPKQSMVIWTFISATQWIIFYLVCICVCSEEEEKKRIKKKNIKKGKVFETARRH